jgi:hypothetical protein
MKSIQKIRKDFQEKCIKCAEDLIELNKSALELNKRMNELALEVDSLLSFMETTIKLQEDGDIPKQECKQ